MNRSADAVAFALRGICQERGGAVVLDSIGVDLFERRFTSIVGASGSGKSSLLRLLNRLDDPVAGEIRYRSRPLGEYPVRELRREIGFVFQTPIMFAGTLRDNLEVAAPADAEPEHLERLMQGALAAAELDPDFLARPAERLSVGEKQRATIARALMTQPSVLLLDEPTAALDPPTAERLIETIRRMSSEQGLTVVMVTHRLEEAARVSEYAISLERGRLTGAGLAAEVLGPVPERRWV